MAANVIVAVMLLLYITLSGSLVRSGVRAPERMTLPKMALFCVYSWAMPLVSGYNGHWQIAVVSLVISAVVIALYQRHMPP